MFNKLLKLIIDNDIKLSIERNIYPGIAIILTFSKNNYHMKRAIPSSEVVDLDCNIGVVIITALEDFIKEYENNLKKEERLKVYSKYKGLRTS